MIAFKPFNRLEKTDIYRLNLPHWRQEGCTYFVTWRLADSVPKEKAESWRHERQAWLALHGLPSGASPEMLTPALRRDYRDKFTRRMEKWMDTGYGRCELRNPACARILRDAFHHFDGNRYVVDRFVIMPNHVHVLVTPLTSHSLESIAHGWKSFSAHQINRLLSRNGTLWLDETWDHIVRSWAQLVKYRDYINRNPIKACLSSCDYLVGSGQGLRRQAEG